MAASPLKATPVAMLPPLPTKILAEVNEEDSPADGACHKAVPPTVVSTSPFVPDGAMRTEGSEPAEILEALIEVIPAPFPVNPPVVLITIFEASSAPVIVERVAKGPRPKLALEVLGFVTSLRLLVLIISPPPLKVVHVGGVLPPFEVRT